MDILNTPLPSNVDAEKVLLGTLMVTPEEIDEISLHSSDFSCQNNNAIFKAIMHIYAKGKSPDILTINEQLKTWNVSEELGGIDYLLSLSSSYFTPSIQQTAEIIKEKSLQRKVITLGHKLLHAGYNDQYEKQEDILEKVASLYDDALRVSGDPTKGITMEEFIERGKLLIPEKLLHVVGISTGFDTLNYAIGGFKEKQVIIIGARPSMGKTALALNSLFATAKTLKGNEKLVFYSLEQSLDALFFRFATMSLGTDKQVIDFERGNISPKERAFMDRMYAETKPLPIIWFEESDNSLQAFKRHMRRLSRRYDVKAVYLDHIGQMTYKGFRGGRTDESAKIMRDLQSFAKEIITCWVLLHQLNRNVEHRPDKRPQLSDLKETGASEEVGDVIIGLYRDEYYNRKTEKKGIIEALILKGRDRGVGKVELLFNKKNLRVWSKPQIGADPYDQWEEQRKDHVLEEKEEPVEDEDLWTADEFPI